MGAKVELTIGAVLLLGSVAFIAAVIAEFLR